MRIPRPHVARPHLPGPWRWRPGRPGEPGAPDIAAAQPRVATTEEDVRLLRRTRLRLMAVSGLVMLVILVVLEGAIIAVVSRATTDAEQTAFNNYVSQHQFLHPSVAGPEASELGGEGANLFMIFVPPNGQPLPPRGQTIPGGLPDPASLKAAASSSTGSDERSVTGTDGTPYYVRTIQYVPVGSTGSAGVWLVQFVQNQTAQVRMLTTLGLILLGGGLLALLASLLAGYLYAGRALVPIRASIERRQSALQRQREFAANASHELRTPLTVIAASVEDLKRNRRSKVEDVGEAIGDIEAEVRHMTALVEDMLLLARTDSGVVQVDRVPLDLGDVAAEAASTLTSVGQERGVSVVLDPLPAAVTGDPLRLRQLVTILVDNAIRHSWFGSTVTVWVRPEPGGALLQVDDQGPGVKPDDLPRLFERFWRADDAPAGGTGLGLAIAKWIVDQHGGSIGAFNRPGSGASFWARLPDAPAGGSAENETASGLASETGVPDGYEPAEWSGPTKDVASPPSDRAEGPIAP